MDVSTQGDDAIAYRIHCDSDDDSENNSVCESHMVHIDECCPRMK